MDGKEETKTSFHQAALGTNPIAFAAPALNGDHFVLDMATSAVAVGKVGAWLAAVMKTRIKVIRLESDRGAAKERRTYSCRLGYGQPRTFNHGCERCHERVPYASRWCRKHVRI